MNGDEITVGSTDGEIEVPSTHSEQTAAAPESPPEPSPRVVTVSSTTDSRENIDAALRGYGGEIIAPAEPQTVLDTPRVAVSGANEDTPEQLRATERDLAEEREEKVAEYLESGRPDRRYKRQLRQISRLTGQRYELREENQQLRERLARYESQPQEPIGREPQQNGGDEGSEPHERQQPQAQAPQPQRKWGEFTPQELEQFQRKQSEGMASFPYRYQLAAQRIPDLEKTIAAAADVTLPEPIIDAMRIEEGGIETAHYLATHKPIAKEINDLWQAGRQQEACQRLDFICNGLRFGALHNPSQHPQRPRREVSPTPEPIRPLSGAGATRSTEDLSDPNMTYAQHREIMNRREYGGKGRR